LQDVPFTQEQMDISNEAVPNALYNAGMIYFDDLDDVKKSIKLLEELVKRYPEHKLYPLACFQLYKEHYLARDEERSEYFKNIILENYPNSHFAQIINDPDYYKKMEAIKNQANVFYTSVYDAFKKNDYYTVANLASEGLSKYPTPELMPKFDFLKAIALGKINGNDTLKLLLKAVCRNYPTTEIDTLAAGILELLKQLETAPPEAQNSTSANSQQTTVPQNVPTYTYDNEAFHFIIIIADIKDISIEQLKGKIVLFNRDFFRLEKFDPISSFYIDDTKIMLTISRFQNKSKAMDYYNLMKTDTTYLENLNSSPAKIYVISDANYNTFNRNKDKKDKQADYEKFFKEYYF
jgi:hypothetical protein